MEKQYDLGKLKRGDIIYLFIDDNPYLVIFNNCVTVNDKVLKIEDISDYIKYVIHRGSIVAERGQVGEKLMQCKKYKMIF